MNRRKKSARAGYSRGSGCRLRQAEADHNVSASGARSARACRVFAIGGTHAHQTEARRVLPGQRDARDFEEHVEAQGTAATTLQSAAAHGFVEYVFESIGA